MMIVPAMARLRLFRFFIPLLIGGGILGSCGLEDYPYLDPVDSGIQMTLNTTAFIRLPELADQSQYFQRFIIYYRIYISGLPVSGTVSTDQLSQINAGLASDYNAFRSYTDVDTSTTAPANMGSIFSNRKYYTLALENRAIENELGSGARGQYITLDFSRNPPVFFPGNTRVNPSLTPITLWRYSESGFMRPYNDTRYFVNSDDVNNGAYINTATYTNLDVQNNAVSGYTYASMYILSYGVDANFANIYSAPTFIGIFRLPG